MVSGKFPYLFFAHNVADNIIAKCYKAVLPNILLLNERIHC